MYWLIIDYYCFRYRGGPNIPIQANPFSNNIDGCTYPNELNTDRRQFSEQLATHLWWKLETMKVTVIYRRVLYCTRCDAYSVVLHWKWVYSSDAVDAIGQVLLWLSMISSNSDHCRWFIILLYYIGHKNNLSSFALLLYAYLFYDYWALNVNNNLNKCLPTCMGVFL